MQSSANPDGSAFGPSRLAGATPAAPSEPFVEDCFLELAKTLPVPSPLAFELAQLLSDGEASREEIEGILRRDPTLAAEAIRYANAAAMGARGTVESLNEALLAIGSAALSRFALAKALTKLDVGPLPTYELTAEQFYRKSLGCAIAMDGLCGERRDPGGRAYTVGLLHAVGELLIDRRLQETLQEEIVFRGVNPRNLSLLERRFAGLSQAEAAAVALRLWGLPETVVNPIRWQFEPAQAGDQADLAEALATARYLASLLVEEERGSRHAAAAAKHLVYRGKSLGKLYEFLKEEIAQLGSAG